MKVIQESQAKVSVPVGEKITRKLEVFYNPEMKSNRDIAIILLNSLQKKNMKIADPLAGSGIRAIRFLKELKKGIIENLYVNDGKPDFPKICEKNLKLNKEER